MDDKKMSDGRIVQMLELIVQFIDSEGTYQDKIDRAMGIAFEGRENVLREFVDLLDDV